MDPGRSETTVAERERERERDRGRERERGGESGRERERITAPQLSESLFFYIINSPKSVFN